MSARETLEELRQILTRQSIRTGTFTLASGTTSHYYCDTKATVLSPRGALLCGRALFHVLRNRDVDAVGGLAMGAAYLATAVAIASASAADQEIYGFTVRPEQKDHGTERRIDESWHPDGRPLVTSGRRVAVVDDVVTSAGSIFKAIDAVRDAGCEIAAVAAVVDRQAGGGDRIRNEGLPFLPLFLADDHGTLTVADEALAAS